MNEDVLRLIGDKESSSPQLFSWMMSQDERKLFISSILGSKNYLEFGAGGSTFSALLNSSAKVYTVESDLNWIKNMRTWKYITEAENSGRLIFEHIDIGKTGDGGTPLENEKMELFPNYSEFVFKKHEVRFDSVLIDGRFRVACALNAIQHGSTFTKYIVHDFWNRPYYRILLKYLDCIDEVDTLMVARAKGGIEKNNLLSDIETYKYNPL